MKHNIIEIDKGAIPYEFEILLGEDTFRIDVKYNCTADLIVLGLSKLNQATGVFERICAGEPLIYGVPLWQDVAVFGKYPIHSIVPFDESGENNAVTFDNLSTTVFLCIDEGDIA